jgi:hypothetical protein
MIQIYVYTTFEATDIYILMSIDKFCYKLKNYIEHNINLWL